MTDMQAAMGLCQLEALDWILERRRVLAERYTTALEQIPQLEAPYDPPYAQRTWQSYCVRVAPGASIGRNELMRQLLADGIATRRGVMAIHRETAYASARGTEAPARIGLDANLSAGSVRADLRHTEAASSETLMLPLFPDLSEEQQSYVIERLATHILARAA
jgi:dTDP-4-amino-4,6-dideoxygalactose transaminase